MDAVADRCAACGLCPAALGTELCASCADQSAQIDRDLVGVSPDDPVSCDVCGIGVAFDARVAVIARGCGGIVLCASCKPAFNVQGAAA